VEQKCYSTSYGDPQYVYNNISIYCYRKDRSFRRTFYTDWQHKFLVKYIIFSPGICAVYKITKTTVLANRLAV